MLFLIEYDRKAGQIVSFQRFASDQQAVAGKAVLDLEIKLRRCGRSHEVVLLDAATEEDLRGTHRRYFESLDTLATIPQYRFG
jgi:hypothetical protein